MLMLKEKGGGVCNIYDQESGIMLLCETVEEDFDLNSRILKVQQVLQNRIAPYKTADMRKPEAVIISDTSVFSITHVDDNFWEILPDTVLT